MATIDELEYYCKEQEPVGALLLTGEWGCGKTYLIDHELKKRLGKDFIIIRISLFGVDSIDNFTKKVRESYIKTFIESLGIDTEDTKVKFASKLFGKIKNAADKLPIPDNAKNILSINVVDLIPIVNMIGKKKVILIFDDLERSQLDEISALGCINEYCENRDFNTIVVANEEKIKKETRYDEMKEKLIERTIRYTPNYDEIIKGILKEFHTPDEEYKQFLNDNKDALVTLYYEEPRGKDVDETSENRKPQNIRSFKCAIQEFYRVYKELVNIGVKNLTEWLLTFVAFELAYKANILSNTDLGSLVWDMEIKKIYPLWYDEKCMLKSAKKWIMTGEWDEILLLDDFERIQRQNKEILPEELVRQYYLLDIDEEVFEAGFPVMLSKAYAGDLTFDEYIKLLEHSVMARDIGYTLNEEIIWSKVMSGIQESVKKRIQTGITGGDVRFIASYSILSNMTEDEKNIYQYIFDCRDSKLLVHALNRKKFLERLQKSPVSAIREGSNKIFIEFDEEMAQSIFREYRQSKNSGRNAICDELYDWWKNCAIWQYINLEKTKNGFDSLISLLREDYEEQLNNKKQITAQITDSFIVKVLKIEESIKNQQKILEERLLQKIKEDENEEADGEEELNTEEVEENVTKEAEDVDQIYENISREDEVLDAGTEVEENNDDAESSESEESDDVFSETEEDVVVEAEDINETVENPSVNEGSNVVTEENPSE